MCEEKLQGVLRELPPPLHNLPIPHIFCQTSPMKHILTSVVLLVLLFPSLASGETLGELVQREGLHYKKFTDVPFTGKVTGKEQGKLKDGSWTILGSGTTRTDS